MPICSFYWERVFYLVLMASLLFAEWWDDFQIILNCKLLGICLLWRFLFVLFRIPLWSWQCERLFDVDGFSPLSHNVELILHNLELQFIRFVSFVILPFCLRCLFSRSALRLPWWILWCWIWRSCLCYLLFLFICQRALDFEVGVLSSPCGMLRWFKLSWTAIC